MGQAGQQPKDVALRYIEEVWNKGNSDTANQFFAQPAQSPGGGSVADFSKTLRSSFPDLRLVVDDVIAEGEKVVVRVTANGTHSGASLHGHAPTNKSGAVRGVLGFRIVNGAIADSWHHWEFQPRQ